MRTTARLRVDAGQVPTGTNFGHDGGESVRIRTAVPCDCFCDYSARLRTFVVHFAFALKDAFGLPVVVAFRLQIKKCNSVDNVFPGGVGQSGGCRDCSRQQRQLIWKQRCALDRPVVNDRDPCGSHSVVQRCHCHDYGRLSGSHVCHSHLHLAQRCRFGHLTDVMTSDVSQMRTSFLQEFANRSLSYTISSVEGVTAVKLQSRSTAAI